MINVGGGVVDCVEVFGEVLCCCVDGGDGDLGRRGGVVMGEEERWS